MVIVQGIIENAKASGCNCILGGDKRSVAHLGEFLMSMHIRSMNKGGDCVCVV